MLVLVLVLVLARSVFVFEKSLFFGIYNKVSQIIKIYRVAQKSKPLPNYQKIVLYRIEVCQWD